MKPERQKWVTKQGMYEYMLGIEITSNNLACMREIECLSIQDRTN